MATQPKPIKGGYVIHGPQGTTRTTDGEAHAHWIAAEADDEANTPEDGQKPEDDNNIKPPGM